MWTLSDGAEERVMQLVVSGRVVCKYCQLKEVLKKRPDLQQLQEERSEASQDSALAEVAEGKASAEDEGEEEEGEEDWEGEEGDEELLA